MKRIIESKKIFNVTPATNLAELKSTYRNLMKEWHPDKFKEDDAQIEMAEAKSKSIIEAYHFLVSIAPETVTKTLVDYTDTINNAGIVDFEYKSEILRINFADGAEYEYYGVPKAIYVKLINAETPGRFARRHILFKIGLCK